MLKRWLLYLGSVAAGLVVVGALLGAFVVALLYPTLPSLSALTDYQPRIPLRVYSADGVLLGEFGEERRALVRIEDVPEVMKHAILAAEDERFYQHGGVDYLSVLRAALANVTSGSVQGAGTITMQVARNFFLTREKTVTRKLREVMLAWKIEANLHKDEILELYINQIFLGQRAYGFAAASQIYFGKALQDVTPAEAAMLAGLPKAPSAYNPVSNPERAKARQLYVLRRMRELNYLTDGEFKVAQTAPLAVRQNLRPVNLDAHAQFVAEMARQVVFDAYGDDAYSRGITVWTTIRRDSQEAAWAAVQKGAYEYDRRHGYRGPEDFVSLPDKADDLAAELERAFADHPDAGTLVAAIVTSVSKDGVRATLASGENIDLAGDGIKFAAKALADKAPAALRIRRGAVIRVAKDDKGHYAIGQLPQVESAFVAIRPSDGALLALVGGLDFDSNKFNHATQALRQPGSSFKPFIYSAALEKGFTPATVINDAPFFVPAEQTGGEAWEPKNYENKFEGPMRLRTALAKSKNLVMVRVLQAIGPQLRAGLHPALRLRSADASRVPDDGPRRRIGDATADGHRLLGVRQWRLSRDALPDREDHRCQGRGAVRGQARGRRQRRRARDRPAQRLHHDVDDARRDRLWHRHRRAGAEAPRHRRQDRHHQRQHRRLVLRVQQRHRRRGVDRLRPAAHARHQRDRRRGGAADLDRVHAEGAEGHAGEDGVAAGRRRVAADQRRFRIARRHEHAVRLLLQRIPAARPRRRPHRRASRQEPAGSARPDLLKRMPRSTIKYEHRRSERRFAADADGQQRTLIAQAAARLVAEHGITDWSMAKRKAARELGLAPGVALPGDDEIEDALGSYHALFGGEEHEAQLRAQREEALTWMRNLAAFEPRLTGGVAAGWATETSGIRLELDAESAKAVELALINAGLRYRPLSANAKARSNWPWTRRAAACTSWCAHATGAITGPAAKSRDSPRATSSACSRAMRPRIDALARTARASPLVVIPANAGIQPSRYVTPGSPLAQGRRRHLMATRLSASARRPARSR